MRRRLRCKKCGTVIESMYVHDLVYCKCRAIFVDGGQEYLRCGGDFKLIEELGEDK